MKTLHRHQPHGSAGSILLTLTMMVLMIMLAGCQRADRHADTTNGQTAAAQPAAGQSTSKRPAVDHAAGDEQPLGQVAEFDGFTLRANISPTQLLHADMARQYGIEAGPDLALLNLVILDKRADEEFVTVSAEVSAHFESLIGHPTAIDMREVEADGRVSYLGTLNTRGQDVFRFVIEARPVGTDETLPLNFEVRLPSLDSE